MDARLYGLISSAFDLKAIEQIRAVEDRSSVYRMLGNWILGYTSRIDDPLIHMLRQYADRALQNVTLAFENESDGGLPDVSEEGFSLLQGDYENRDVSREDVAALVAGFLYETRTAQAFRIFSDISGPTILLDAELASYAAWSNSQTIQRAASENIASAIARFDDASKASMEALDKQLHDASRHTMVIQNAEREASNAFSEIKALVQNQIDNAKDVSNTFRQQYDALRLELQSTAAQVSALTEKVATKSAQKLWEERASRSRWMYGISFGFLVLLLVGLPTVALVNLDTTLDILRHVGDATMQGLPANPTDGQLTIAAIGKLVVVTLPIAFYIWLLRLIVRFNTRSMVLWDDARQRETMMDTYFHLIEKQAAQKEDRALILAALFRPAPGHGPDNVDPPSFTDLMEKLPKP